MSYSTDARKKWSFLLNHYPFSLVRSLVDYSDDELYVWIMALRTMDIKDSDLDDMLIERFCIRNNIEDEWDSDEHWKTMFELEFPDVLE